MSSSALLDLRPSRWRRRRSLTAPLRRRCSRSPIRLESPGTRSTARRGWARTASCSAIYKLRTMVRGAEFTGAGLAIAGGRRRGSRGSARSCAATRSTSCPTCGTCCAARCRSSGRGRRSRSRSSSTPSASAGGWRSSPGITGWAQVNGRASLPWPERIELDLWYVEHRSLRARPADPGPDACGWCSAGDGPLQGSARADGSHPDRSERRRAAHRRRQALRHRVGVRPARDRRSPPIPTRWRRRSTPPTTAARCRGSTIPGTCRRSQALCDEFARRRRRAAHRSRPRGARPRAGRRRAAGVRPRPRDRPRDLRQVRGPPAARAPGPAVAADGAARRAGRQLSR